MSAKRHRNDSSPDPNKRAKTSTKKIVELLASMPQFMKYLPVMMQKGDNPENLRFILFHQPWILNFVADVIKTWAEIFAMPDGPWSLPALNDVMRKFRENFKSSPPLNAVCFFFEQPYWQNVPVVHSKETEHEAKELKEIMDNCQPPDDPHFKNKEPTLHEVDMKRNELYLSYRIDPEESKNGSYSDVNIDSLTRQFYDLYEFVEGGTFIKDTHQIYRTFAWFCVLFNLLMTLDSSSTTWTIDHSLQLKDAPFGDGKFSHLLEVMKNTGINSDLVSQKVYTVVISK